MVLRKVITFADWTELTEVGNGFVDDSNPVLTNHAENDLDNALYTTSLDSKYDVSGVIRTVIFRWAHKNDGASLLQSLNRCYMTDGTNYLFLGFDTDGSGNKLITLRNGANRTDWNATEFKANASWTNYIFQWAKVTIAADNSTITVFVALDQGANKPTEAGWLEVTSVMDGLPSLTMGGITEIGIFSGIGNIGFAGAQKFYDDLELVLEDYTIFPEGLDASIKFDSYYLRTALNGGGNATLVAPSPFYSPVSAATFKAQEKKQITYTNAFGVIQFLGEAGAIRFSTHGVSFEAEEMIRKTMYTEVGDTPIIFSTFLRQWNGLEITDKDGGFVSRGVTTSHILAFAKADTKVYEGRATRDEFTIVEEDFSSPIVPQQVSNGKDEEMYYFDKWDSVDTDKAHIMIDDNTAGAGSENDPFVVKYPVDLYEKFNNLTKLNKIEIKTTISALKKVGDRWKAWPGDDKEYHWYIYNYQSTTFDKVQSLGETELGGDSTTSTVYATAAFYDPREISIDIIDVLKTGVDNWNIATTYSSGDRAINEDILYTYVDGTPSSGQEPPDTKWQRTAYDYIDYETTAGSSPIFSKLNCIVAIECTAPFGIAAPFIHGFWIWDFSVKATFDEDNEPEFSSAAINTVTATTITLDATSGINLPEADGFGVGDVMSFVKSAEDYLQDTWDISDLATNLGALNINVTNGSTVGITDDHTYKSFFVLMQHISDLTNSTFWADYSSVSTVEMASADSHSSTGITLTRDDIDGYNTEQWEITYDATKQRNQIRILGDNVNFLKAITPDADPFDLGDEIEIIEDSDIQTLLQASDLADSIAPRFTSSEITASVTLNYSVPNQDYTNVEVGKTIALKLPTTSDTSIADFSTGNDGELLIIAIELNRNEETGDQDHATLMLQRRYS
ncbi:hypothetical protein KAR91_79990 [Candidatus Pacearchaeota archaeon]|nr:hypothetical protein [Candidatus Pacearchaeota archaeon]